MKIIKADNIDSCHNCKWAGEYDCCTHKNRTEYAQDREWDGKKCMDYERIPDKFNKDKSDINNP